MNSITFEDITSLKGKGRDLTELLLKLLFLEQKKYNFPDCKISVPQNITVADGGEDGRIETTDSKDSMQVTDNYCMFQCKASNMPKSKCAEEVLESDGKTLKKRVKEVLEKNGKYILVTTQAIANAVEIENRIKAIREAIKIGLMTDNVDPKKALKISNTVKIEIYDANRMANWTNDFLPAVIFVKSKLGQNRPVGLGNWEDLKFYQENTAEFISNKVIDERIKLLRQDIHNGKHIRIEGESGIGKTRLICEVLSPGITNPNGQFDQIRKSNSERTIYVRAGLNTNEILSFIRSHVSEHAILVIDNCPYSIHKEFLDDCNKFNSNLTLITIDFDKSSEQYDDRFKKVELLPENYKSITEEILSSKYKGLLNGADIKYLIDFSEGNTMMAIRFADASIRKINLSETLDNDLIKKIIFGRENEVENEFNILKKISVFQTLNFPRPELYSIDSKAYLKLLEDLKFISDFFKIDINTIRTTIDKFIIRGNIEWRGNKIFIRPSSLALKLSLIFWSELPPEKYEEFILQVPETMRISLVDQLKRLGGVEKAKQFVSTIWGVDGNFSTAEILNSNMGSRLFRSVVTVNPEATTKVLVKHFLDKPIDYLKSIIEGRQNLVWALEALCFRKETFHDASKVLMSFAVAEIETYYSNNATSYFLQLFHMHLAGTQVGYKERIEILQWALNKEDLDFEVMTLEACQSAFNSFGPNYRTLGAENQGGAVPLEEYKPQHLSDIHKYWDSLILILKKYINLDSKLGTFSHKIIYNNLNSFDEYRYDLKEVEILLTQISNYITDKKAFIQSLRRIKRMNGTSKEMVNMVNKILDKFTPQTLNEKIEQYVTIPEYHYHQENRGEYELILKSKISKLAEDIVSNNVDLSDYYKKLFIGQQYKSFYFGEQYGKLIGYDQEFIESLITYLTKIENQNWDASFLNGYVSSLNKKEQTNLFDSFVDKRSIFTFMVYKVIGSDFKNSLKLIDLLKKDLDPKNLRYAHYQIANLKSHELVLFLSELEKLTSDNLAHIFFILSIRVREINKDTLDSTKKIGQYLIDLNRKHNLLEITMNSNFIDLYNWEDCMKFLILIDPISSSKIIASKIVSYYRLPDSLLRSDFHVTDIAIITIDINFTDCWSIYSSLLLELGGRIPFGNIFDIGFIMGSENTHRFFQNPERNQKIFDWIKINPITASWFARVSPLNGVNGEWFNFTEQLIDEFGNNERFIRELSSNVFSMSTVGSRVPYLESRLDLVKKLINHKHLNLTNWINKEILRIEKEIQIEKISDEEENLRF